MGTCFEVARQDSQRWRRLCCVVLSSRFPPRPLGPLCVQATAPTAAATRWSPFICSADDHRFKWTEGRNAGPRDESFLLCTVHSLLSALCRSLLWVAISASFCTSGHLYGICTMSFPLYALSCSRRVSFLPFRNMTTERRVERNMSERNIFLRCELVCGYSVA